MIKIQKKILKENKTGENNFFFENENGDSWRMIFSLISSDLSCSPIFLQGVPGSGKSAAARHYGSFRSFQNRIPILSISCNSDLTFDYFVGNYSFQNSKFKFVEGPLLIAVKKGEPILFDEINLCSEEVLINLLPLFKANINDIIQLKGVPYPIRIKPGFLFIATGNDDNEFGRKKIPQIILDELTRIEIKEPKFDEKSNLLNTILIKEYKECVDDKLISVEQLSKIINQMKKICQYNTSLRQIKCLLRRIRDFCRESDDELLKYPNVALNKIPVIYIIIGYFIPALKIVGDRIIELIKKFDEIMNYNNLEELKEFITSPVEFFEINKQNEKIDIKKIYIKKGKICLRVNINENFPQIMMQIFFWIRMSCSFHSDTPSVESLLLTGPTSYKSFLLNKWLSNCQSGDFLETHILTKKNRNTKFNWNFYIR